MNILEYCYTLISYCYRKKKIVREKENIIPQPKRNRYSENEPKIFEPPFEKPFEKIVSNNYIVVNQSDDEEEYDIV